MRKSNLGRRIADNGNTYAWNLAAGRLRSVTNGTEIHNFGYDAIGRRGWKELHNGTDTLYIYAGPNCIAEYDTSSGQLRNEYIYSGGVDSLAMVVHPDSLSPKRLSVVRNQQWSVVGLFDPDAGVNGEIVEQYAYDVFGKRHVFDGAGTLQVSGSAYGNDYGYTSRRHDAESGLMYFRARFYDPTTGEFLSIDALGFVYPSFDIFHDGFSLWRSYTGLNSVDPLGLDEYRLGFDDVPNSDPLDKSTWKSKRNTATTLLLGIQARAFETVGGGKVLYPDAARHLRHFLGNTGKELVVNHTRMIDESRGANLHYIAEKNDARKAVEKFATKPGEIIEIVTIGENGDGNNGGSGNWEYAVGKYRTWAKAKARKNGDGTYTMKWSFYMRDNYDWEYDINPGGLVYDYEMRLLHLNGWAREYEMKGIHVEADTWKKGERVPASPKLGKLTKGQKLKPSGNKR